jgi:hypothetical protein
VAYQHLKTVLQLVRLFGADGADAPQHPEPDRRDEKLLDLLRRIARGEAASEQDRAFARHWPAGVNGGRHIRACAAAGAADGEFGSVAATSL